jgi:hypothetical protein
VEREDGRYHFRNDRHNGMDRKAHRHAEVEKKDDTCNAVGKKDG